MRAIPRHFPDAHVRVIDGHVLPRHKFQAEQTSGGVERRRDHLVELEIGHDLALIEIVARLAQPLGIVAPVPGGELEISAFLGDQSL